MAKKLKTAIAALIMTLFVIQVSYAAEADVSQEEGEKSSESYVESILDEQLRQLNLNQLEKMMPVDEYKRPVLDISVKQIIQNVIDKKPMIDMRNLTDVVLDYFTHEIKSNISFAIEIIAVCIMIGLLKNMSNSFGQDAVSQVAVLITSCAAVGICIKSFVDIYRICDEAITSIADIMQSLLPVMITLMISSGSISSGAILNPVILAAVSIFVSVTVKVVLPGIFTASVFFLINGLTEKDYIKRMGKLIRTACLFIIGLCITIFSGIIALQGVVTSSADSVLIKGAKFSVDKFIPVIGGFVSDSLGLIMSCAGFIKSAVGVFGAMLIIITVMIPIIKIVVISVIFKLASVIIEPLGEQKISDSINEIGNTAMTLAVILALSGILFLIFITILLGIGRM